MRAVSNPPNPWQTTAIEWLDDIPVVRPAVFEETARSIVSDNDSPDLPFRHSVNPYRGCHHGCAYCYARPTHQYLDWGAGSDFESKIVVKINAPELLRKKLSSKNWDFGYISFSGVTDCYQPLEATYQITRRCLEVCRDFSNPVGIITKGALVQRDAELIAAIQQCAGATVYLSIPFDDADMARKLEPWVSTPERRYQTLTVLNRVGVPVGVSISPVIPGLNDSQIGIILEKARAAGASRAFMTPLRLPDQVEPVFRERLAAAYPLRVNKVFNALNAIRNGNIKTNKIHERMNGSGVRWAAIEQLFRLKANQLGYNNENRSDACLLAPPVRQREQLTLF